MHELDRISAPKENRFPQEPDFLLYFQLSIFRAYHLATLVAEGITTFVVRLIILSSQIDYQVTSIFHQRQPAFATLLICQSQKY